MLYNAVRPVSFDAVVGQDMVRESLRSQSIAGNFFGLYIFCGQFGGGKTTMARIVALAANCEHKDEKGNPCLSCPSCRAILESSTPDIVEIDGASNNGVDKVRDLIASVDYRPLSLKKKVIIIDEVHMLSKAAFNALLKTLEEPPSYCIFILCTTDADAIPATVKSRAAIYRFRAIAESVIEERLKTVAEEKELICEGEALALLSRYANGSMRNALSLLEQAALSGTVTPDGVLRLVGARNYRSSFELLTAILTGNLGVLTKKCSDLSSDAVDFSAITDDCLSVISDAVMYQYDTECVRNTAAYKTELSSLVAVTESIKLLQLSEVLLDLKAELKRDGNGNVFLLRLARFCKDEDRIMKLENRILHLEEMIRNGSVTPAETVVKKVEEEVKEPPVADIPAVESVPVLNAPGSDGFSPADTAENALFSSSDEKDGFASRVEASSESVEVVSKSAPTKVSESEGSGMRIVDVSAILFGRSFT